MLLCLSALSWPPQMQQYRQQDWCKISWMCEQWVTTPTVTQIFTHRHTYTVRGIQENSPLLHCPFKVGLVCPYTASPFYVKGTILMWGIVIQTHLSQPLQHDLRTIFWWHAKLAKAHHSSSVLRTNSLTHAWSGVDRMCSSEWLWLSVGQLAEWWDTLFCCYCLSHTESLRNNASIQHPVTNHENCYHDNTK